MKKKDVKTNQDKWFIEKRKSYFPISWQAWICYLFAVLYLSLAFTYIVGLTDNPAWIIFHGIRELLGVGIILTWIAQQKS